MSCVHFVCAHVCACRGRRGPSVSPSTKETRYLTEHGASGLQLQQASHSHPSVSAAFRAGVRDLCTAMPVEPSLVYQGLWWLRAHLVPEADLELLSPEMTACAFTPGCHSPLSLFHSVSTGDRPQGLAGIGGTLLLSHTLGSWSAGALWMTCSWGTWILAPMWQSCELEGAKISPLLRKRLRGQ